MILFSQKYWTQIIDMKMRLQIDFECTSSSNIIIDFIIVIIIFTIIVVYFIIIYDFLIILFIIYFRFYSIITSSFLIWYNISKFSILLKLLNLILEIICSIKKLRHIGCCQMTVFVQQKLRFRRQPLIKLDPLFQLYLNTFIIT